MNHFQRFYVFIFQLFSSFKLWVRATVKRVLSYLTLFSAMAGLTTIILFILDIGFHLSDANHQLFESIYDGILLYFIIDLSARLFLNRKTVLGLVSRPTELCIIFLAILKFSSFSFGDPYAITRWGVFIVMIGRVGHFRQLFDFLKLKPAQIFPLGFLFTIFLGSVLLSLPIATKAPEGILYIDALFMVFSAVCVTGLSVVDVSSTFTVFGQTVILILIQVGGLGIMTFAMLLSRLLNRRVSSRDSAEFQETYSAYNLRETYKTILFIFKLTFSIELIGAAVLTLLWHQDFSTLLEAIYFSLFHSISAFCNAGFSLFPDSLVGYATNVPVIGVMALLIIIGGLGFPVILNTIQVWKTKKSVKWLKLQSKLVLWMTLVLIVLGTAVILLLEFDRALAPFSLVDKTTIAFFQSVSARTAGFNTIDLSTFHVGTILFMTVLMVIGASPGSTGGGIKTTSFALISLSFLTTLRSSKKHTLSGRTIKEDSILKAFALFFLAFMLIFLFLFILSFVEEKEFVTLFFEVVSAFGTVGYSLGITPLLSDVGKVLMMILMFIGRIGPLSLAFALSRSKPEAKYSYPKENIAIV